MCTRETLREIEREREREERERGRGRERERERVISQIHRCCSLTLFHYQWYNGPKISLMSSISISSVIVPISAWSQLWGRF